MLSREREACLLSASLRRFWECHLLHFVTGLVTGLRTLRVQMKKSSEFLKRREEVTEFNKKHKWLKRGISMTHCRYAFGRRPPFMHLS